MAAATAARSLHLDEASSLATRYSAVASDGKNATEAREAAMLLATAEGYIDHDEDENALTAAQDALAIFRKVKDHASIADSLRVIIKCYVSQGRTQEGMTLALEELASFKKAKLKSQEAKLLLSLAEACGKQSKLTSEALGYSKEALSIFRDIRDEKMEALVWLTTANLLIEQKTQREGEDPLKGAQQAANDALAIFDKLGDQKGKAAALLMSAEVKAAAGDIDDAVDVAEEALDVLQELNSQKLEAFMLEAIAKMCLAHGRPFKALYFAENALEIIRQQDASKKKEVAALGCIVSALIAKGLTGKAVQKARAGLKRFQDSGDSRSEADTQRVLYSAYHANGDTEQAALTMDKALEAAQDAGDQSMETRLLCEASDMSLKGGNVERAVETASRALEIAKDAKAWDAANKALQSVVNAYIAQEDAKKAVDAAAEMRDMFDSSNDAKAEAGSCLVLSCAHCAAGSFDLAASAAKAASEIAYEEEDEFLEASSLDQLAVVYMDAGKYEKAAHAAENARRIWKDQEDLPRVCNALDQIAKAFVQQAYKKQASGKSASAVTAIFEKATKAGNDCIVLANDLPGTENGNAFMANASCTLSQVHAALGESEEAFATAKTASDLFYKAGDERGGGYALVLMAQADVQQEKWEKALKNAKASMKVFQKFKNEMGKTFAQTVLDKIEKSMPKPKPVEQTGWGGGGLAWNRPQGQQQMPGQGQIVTQQLQAGGGVFEGAALDTSMGVTEEALAAKIKEVALAIIGEDADDIEADTPLMEAGLTSSSAVLMRDELLGVIPGVKIAPTAMFDYPSISSMSEMLLEQMKG